MNRLFKKTGMLVATLTLISISSVQASQPSLYLFYNDKNVGETNQVLGIAKSLKQNLPNLVERTFKLEDRETLLSTIHQNFTEESGNKGILISSGNDGIAFLAQLGRKPNVVTAHSSHQYTKDHGKLKNIATLVALPKHAVTPEILETIQGSYTTVIQTPGVSHNLSPVDIQKAYHEQKATLPDAKKYLGIILGGDAETPDKTILYYTPKEAQQMAEYIAPQVTRVIGERPHLLILNGPRTGKHDQATGKVIETSHRDGKIDAVTTSFTATLMKQGLVEGKDFTLLDFQFGKPGAYPFVLGALYGTKSSIFVAGESTSMVSETADCLPGLVTVYTHGAMNGNHRKHCESEYGAGRVHILENQNGNWKLLTTAAISPSQDSRPASQIIAEAIGNLSKSKK